MAFLPTTMKDCLERGWQEIDFVLVTGDAYVDHPSFGTAIIGRVLEGHGFRVAVLAQPDWKTADDFKRFGRPRLGFLISSGNVDSMVNHYSVLKNKRKSDSYSAGGAVGKRPDRAVIVYSHRAREAYKGIPVIIGGLEASLRRLAHYDYWDDQVRRSVLLDSKADLLVYGMGEKAMVEIAEALEAGIEVKSITWIKGTCYKTNEKPDVYLSDEDTLLLPSFEEIKGDKKAYCRSFALQYRNNDALSGKHLIEQYENGFCVVQNPPQPPLSREELDRIYELPYEGTYAPEYEAFGGVPAIREVKFSITGSRGCFGGCGFCALTFHQGREVRSRSKASIIKEAERLTKAGDFKGYIHDIGGPTANFTVPSCEKQLKSGMCKDKDCLFPKPCSALRPDHSEYLEVLAALRQVAEVKKVFIRSGIRYDYLLADKNSDFLETLCKHHVSGTLKVAPEHVSKNVLAAMRKPSIETFERFCKEYERVNKKLGLRQYLIPYFMSSHPGSTVKDAIELALFLNKTGFIPDQVQDFYPTPGTLSTCMYYAEMDPFTMEPIYVAKTMEEKKTQRALIHFHKPENRKFVEKALSKAGRDDLKAVLLNRGRRK